MAATESELETAIATLKRGLSSAHAKVSYDGRTIEYRTVADIRAAIKILQNDLDALKGPKRPRVRTIIAGRGV